MNSCYIQQVSAICALGPDIATIATQLFTATQSPLTFSDAYSPGRPLPLGIVADIPAQADTRNNALLAAAIEPLRAQVEELKMRFGADRIGVILGSSTSGIAEGEAAVAHHLQTGTFPPAFRYGQQEMSAPSAFVVDQLQLQGPSWTISTACTSGAKAIASGARLLALGVCDAVVVGGADSLCQLTVEGFMALSATSAEITNPFSLNRRGINIGEAAALLILTREPGPVRVAGAGETSDAHHISAPEPEGRGAAAAISAALADASLTPDAIDYINLHGTATEQNDRMESLAVARILGADIPCNSTKPLTGHTLGAAGALEAVFCYLALMRADGKLPSALWDGVVDPELATLNGLGAATAAKPLHYAMSNSFAFGGNNISLILERCHD
ncbi:MAG: beta-ketoacyl-ACP synthase [Gammaproteobacteria bacterium]|nr:MAG: beta-ketoacyl-ACP synthase [Gammaproteobacteria bacterium]